MAGAATGFAPVIYSVATYLTCTAALLAAPQALTAQTSNEAVAYQINVGHTGVQTDSALTLPFIRRWKVTLPGTASYPLIADGLVFVTAIDGNGTPALYALDPATGRIVWSRELPGDATYKAAALTYDNHRVFVTTANGLLSAFASANGTLLWSTELTALFPAAPVAANKVVYVAINEGLLAFDELSGGLLARQSVGSGGSSPGLSSAGVSCAFVDQAYGFSAGLQDLLWHDDFDGDGGGSSNATVDTGRMFSHGYSGNRVLDVVTGGVLGTMPVTNIAPAVNQNAIWLLQGSSLVAENIAVLNTPVIKWTFTGDGQLITAPVVLANATRNLVFIGSASGMLYAVDDASGAVAWSYDVGVPMTTPLETNSSQTPGMAIGQGLIAISASNSVSAFVSAPPSGYFPVPPSRVVDSRPGFSTVDGQFAGIGPFPGGHTQPFTIVGRAGIPTHGVTAVVLNVTAVNATGPGFATVWPTGEPRPLASNLNFDAAETIANLVIVAPGTNGEVSLFTSLQSQSMNLIVDVVGYFTGESGINAISPQRLLDTRAGGKTIDNIDAGIGALGPSIHLAIDVAGRGQLPRGNVGAIVLNLTATNPSARGYLTAWPEGEPKPIASNLSFSVGDTIPNLIISSVGASGQISIFNSAGDTDLVADAQAWFPFDSDLVTVAPARILDTRAQASTIDGQYAGGGALVAQQSLSLLVAGRAGVPVSGAGTLILNITGTNATRNAFVTTWASGSPRPNTSNLNIVPAQTISNLVVAQIGSDGKVLLFNSAGSTDLIVDVLGWFSAAH